MKNNGGMPPQERTYALQPQQPQQPALQYKQQEQQPIDGLAYLRSLITQEATNEGIEPFSLSMSQLALLSNLAPARSVLFWEIWQQIRQPQRLEIVKALRSMAEDNITLDFRDIFVLCLDDPDSEVRSVAIDGLWEDERPMILRRLIQLVDDPSPRVRAVAIMGLSRFSYRSELGELSDQETTILQDTLLRMIEDDEQEIEVRRRAVESIGYFSDLLEVEDIIDDAYGHPELFMRESALVAMGRSMNPIWHPYIERELQSSSPAMRYEAARAVGEHNEDGRPLLPRLVGLVDDEDDEVAQAAIWALGQVGGASARRVLERLVRSRDDIRAQSAEEALEELLFSEDDSLL